MFMFAFVLAGTVRRDPVSELVEDLHERL